MKNWMKNIICSREWTENGSGMDRVWSRIHSFFHSLTPDSILSRFCLGSLIWIIIGGFSTNAWGATVTYNSSSYSSGSAPYIITQDSVTFSMNVPNWYENENKCHFFVYTSNTTATIGWTPATGFTIAVTGVSLNGQNAEETHYYSAWWHTHTGSSYIRSHTASDNTEVQISQSNSNATKSYTTANTNLFPDGNALGNSAYFKLRAEKGNERTKGENSYEYQISWATITYTVTPPAPTLKNGSSATRSQFVEGRENNTLTLTDYFKPFNSGVAMTYEVKKKNGSGVYETINSGYTITSNVFKTTVVGEYQIFANSNATGAFNASSSSSALAVTIEEVRPVTISVGSQELYVGGTTSMTITEQLNTTEDVVFSFDEDFFDYNESTHVLTAKNDANASFSTIEKSIRVTQATDGEFAAVDMYINFTIKKRENTIQVNGNNVYAGTLNVDSSLGGIVFSSTANTDLGSSFDVDQTDGDEDILDYTYTSGTRTFAVTSNHRLGLTTWTVSQDENYKYLAGERTFTVEVVKAAEATDCYVKVDTDGEHGMYGLGTDNYDLDWKSEGYGDKISFEAKRNGVDAAASIGLQLKLGNNSNYESDDWKVVADAQGLHTEYDNVISYTFDAKDNVTGVRFHGVGAATRSKYVRNIYVTRRTWLTHDTDTLKITKTAGNNPIYPHVSDAVQPGAGQFDIRYSMANGGNLKLVCDNDKFRFGVDKTADYTITVSDCSADTVTIPVTYTSVRAGNDTANVIIYNKVYRDTIVLVGTTVKHNQVGKWKDNISTVKIGTEITNAYTSTLSDDKSVAYTRLSGSSITIEEDGTLIAFEEGTSRIRAFVDSSALYNQIADTIDIAVTTDEIQYIVWGEGLAQTLRRLTTEDEDGIVLSATAQSDVAGCTTNGSRPVTFASRNTSVVSVNNETNTLTVVGKGRTWLVASQAGGDDEEDEEHKHNDYLPVSDSLLVIVRDPNDLCPEYYLYNFNDSTKVRSETIMGEAGANFVGGKVGLSNTIRTLTTGTFSHAPAYATWCYKRSEKGAGSITLQQYIPGTGWETVSTRTSFAETWAKDSVAISSEATRVQVVPSESTSYLYIGSFKVGMASYVEVVEDEDEKETLVFSGKIGSNSEKEVTVRWYHNRDVQVVLEDGAPFSLKLNDDEESVDKILDADCKIDTVPSMTIIYEPLKAEVNQEYTLLFTDGVEDGFRKTITLQASADAEIVEFTAKDDNHYWATDANWSSKPNQYRVASIKAGEEVTIATQVEAYGLTIGSGSKVTILPSGGLKVYAGGITGATKDNFVLQVSEAADATKGKTAFLRISPEYTGAMPEVTMEMLRIGYSASYTQDNFNARGTMAWQYMGAPIDAAGTLLKSIVGGWINSWDETTGTWVNNKSTVEVTPFVGFANSQSKSADGAKTSYKGKLVANQTQNIDLSYTEASDMAGWNLLANSFSAPIEIVKMLDDINEDEIETSIYLFNTGNTTSVDGTAGTYTVVPIANAGKTVTGVTYPGVIPAMQGFFVKAKKEDVSLKLDYSKIVWGADHSTSPNTPLRMKAENEEESPIYGVYITLMANGARDNLHIIESQDFSPSRDKGYDAAYMPVGGFNIFAVEGDDDYLAVDATNSIIGTKIGLRTGEEYVYTMKFSPVIVDNAIALLDKEEGKEIAIEEGMEYTFYATQNATITDRFEIVARGNAPEISTGNETVETKVKAQKFIKNNSLYIYKDGVLYNALGERVR